jgi:hypothetical protein
MEPEIEKLFSPMRVFADKQGEFFIPVSWIKEEGRLPRKKKGCTHYVKAGPNDKEIYTHYFNPDFLIDEDAEDLKRTNGKRDNKEEIMQRLTTLINDINRKKKFGSDYSEEKREADEIEKDLVNYKAQLLNDEFISMHNWNTQYMSEARKWDVIVYKNFVCRISEMYKTNYDEGSDTFSYHAKAEGIFLKEVLSIDFGYYDQVKILNT